MALSICQFNVAAMSTNQFPPFAAHIPQPPQNPAITWSQVLIIHYGIQWIPAVCYCTAPFPRLVKPSKVGHFIGGNTSASPSSQMRMLTVRFAGRLEEWHTILSGNPSRPDFHCKTHGGRNTTLTFHNHDVFWYLCLSSIKIFLFSKQCHWIIGHNHWTWQQFIKWSV